MQLLFSPTSPYARKVRAVLIEKRLEATVDLVAVNPLADPPNLRAANPLGKVPALILDNGRALFDSPLICAYLDEIGSGPKLVPSEIRARYDVVVREALADGVMDAAFNLVMEQRRPPEQQSPEWTGRWTTAILAAAAEMTPGAAGPGIDLGEIATACALGYLDFRLPALDWRSANPGLGAWFGAILARPSLARTEPPKESAR
jgi:glutathione S-transferase